MYIIISYPSPQSVNSQTLGSDMRLRSTSFIANQEYLDREEEIYVSSLFSVSTQL